jgi:3-oxoacyl-[acyl-carrier-protein] synthase-1
VTGQERWNKAEIVSPHRRISSGVLMVPAQAIIRVIGAGARTAIGLTAAGSATAFRAGIAGMTEHPKFTDKMTQPMIVAAAPYLDPELCGAERLVALALPAAREAAAALPDRAAYPGPLRVVVGLPEPRPGLPGDLDQVLKSELASAFSDRGPVRVETIAGGHAAGLMALERGLGLLRGQECSVCLVGGVDSYLEKKTLVWLDYKGRLHSDHTTWGFCPGEAAGFVLLVRESGTQRRPEKGTVQVLAAATHQEDKRIYTDSVCTGLGLSAAFRDALAPLAGTEKKVGRIICDMNGEPYRADEFGFTKVRMSQLFEPGVKMDHPADCWGDVGAASGPLFVILADAAARKKNSAPVFTLVWASSEAGRRSAALLVSETPGG